MVLMLQCLSVHGLSRGWVESWGKEWTNANKVAVVFAIIVSFDDAQLYEYSWLAYSSVVLSVIVPTHELGY